MDNQSTQQSQILQKQTPVKILQWVYLIWGGSGAFSLVSKLPLFSSRQPDIDYVTPYYNISLLSLSLGLLTTILALTVGFGLLRYTKYSLTIASWAGYVLLPILIINSISSQLDLIGIFEQLAGPQSVVKTATFSILGFYAIIFLIIQLAIVIFTIKTVRKTLKTVDY